MNQERHLPVQTWVARDTRQMTNGHRENGSSKELCESILRPWQMSEMETKDENISNSSFFFLF